jgi:lipoyl(octanoyl) transferase
LFFGHNFSKNTHYPCEQFAIYLAYMYGKNKKVSIKQLGRLAYQEAWDIQEEVFNEIVSIKLENRKLDKGHQKLTPNYLLFCEHPHVYTLGKSGSTAHLLASESMLQTQGVSLYATNRGGDITYHGPGQLVVYPILDLENFFTDIHRYLRCLEEAVIATLNDFGLLGTRVPGLTGVWLDHQDQQPICKVCAIGVRTSRWVTMHGLALNINTDLSYFDQIIPCGIQDRKVTSMAAALGTQQNLPIVAQNLEQHMMRLFDMELVHC